MSRAALVAITLALPLVLVGGTRPGGGGYRTTDPCATRADYSTSWNIEQPDEGCCSLTSCQAGAATAGNEYYKRVTRDRLARMQDVIYVVGNLEAPVAAATIPIDPLNSACFSISVGNGNITSAYISTYVADIAARAAAAKNPQPPKAFRNYRFDLAPVGILAASEPGESIEFPSKDWVLRTTRTFKNFADWHATSCYGGGSCCYVHCRTPSSTYDVNDCWHDDFALSDCYANEGAANDTGCDDTGGEGLWTLAQQLAGREQCLWTSAAFYTIYRTGGAATHPHSAPSAVVMDMTHPDYVDWVSDYAALIVEREGVFGIDLIQKFSTGLFRLDDGTAAKAWPDVAGDAIASAGTAECQNATGAVDTITEALDSQCSVSFNGPLVRADASTYTYPDEVYGTYLIAQELQSRGIYYRWRISPAWYRDCGTTCGNQFDWADTDESECVGAGNPHAACTGASECVLDCNEALMIRAIVTPHAYVLVDLQGKAADDTTTGIGSSTTNLTYNQLVTYIGNTVGAPPWIKPYDTNSPLGTAPKICNRPGETNPETPL